MERKESRLEWAVTKDRYWISLVGFEAVGLSEAPFAEE